MLQFNNKRVITKDKINKNFERFEINTVLCLLEGDFT